MPPFSFAAVFQQRQLTEAEATETDKKNGRNFMTEYSRTPKRGRSENGLGMVLLHKRKRE